MFDTIIIQHAILVASALVIAVLGVRLSSLADRFADKSGLGEAVTGAVFLGAMTSAPGLAASVSAALAERPELAFSNAIGGIMAQTLFIAFADFAYRKANLEHAAASLENVVTSAGLIVLLTLPPIAALLPEVTLFAVHPVSPMLIFAYLMLLRYAHHARSTPMWHPEATALTKEDSPDEPRQGAGSLLRALGILVLVGLFVAAAGHFVAQSGGKLAAFYGISGGVVGFALTAVITSLPELVVTVAAVRRGALTMAMSGILGGNLFDTLFLAAADTAFRPGSLYHEVSERQLVITLGAVLMTAVVLLGMLRRERGGPGNIGLEGAALMLIYALAAAVVVTT